MGPSWSRELFGACGKKKRAALWENKILNVGIIFLTSEQEKLREVLPLLLSKLNKLEFRYDTEKRPFACFLYPNGVLAQQSLTEQS